MVKSFQWILCAIVIPFFIGLWSCSVPKLPDVTPPIVVMIHPAPAQVVTGVVPVVASATDDKEVSQMHIFIDGTKVASKAGNIITYNWDTTPIADNRDHYLMALATDKEGNTGFSPLVTVRVVKGSQPDTLAPLVTIINPVSGQTVRGVVNVVANVVDQSRITQVDFYVDGKLAYTDLAAPFEFSWNVSDSINGTIHSLFARAFDENGNSSVSATVTVTISSDHIQDITPPVVTMLYPPAGATFSVSTHPSINVVVDASDESGIDRAEFYVDGNLMETDNQAPYEYTWDLTGYADGNLHTVYVKVYDTAGNFNAVMNVVTITP